MRKLLLLTTFFTLTPIVFVFALNLFLLTSHQDRSFAIHNSYDRKVAFAALPTSQNSFGDTIKAADARVELLRQFFARSKSPLEPYAELFVQTAEKYQLDFRLLPSIAMQESNLCLKSREDSFNCWGFGVHGGKYKYFESYPHAIETVSKALAERYRDQHGLVTPGEIQKMYNPTNTNSWAESVTHFMNTLQ